MKSAHVLIRLRDNDLDQRRTSRDIDDGRSPMRSDVGVRRTSATSVRLEHSDLSPGVASISFEQVYDQQHTNVQIFETSLTDAIVNAVLNGTALTVVTTGAVQAGKSFCMHGDHESNSISKGLIELAVERVFSVVSECHEWQVLLVAGYTQGQENRAESTDSLIDAFSGEACVFDPSDKGSPNDDSFLPRAVRVENASEAIRAYAHALKQATSSNDFVSVLFVESRTKSGSIHRSRLCFIDVHGNSIIEPTMNDQGDNASPKLFAETHFPVNTILTKWCGGFLGNISTTFVIVAIQTSAKKQQQAIQSLLFACKAKEIKSAVKECEIETFFAAPMYSDVEAIVEEPEGQDGVLLFLGSPVSSVSSTPIKTIRPLNASDVLSERLRQAYQSVKSSTSRDLTDTSLQLKSAEEIGLVGSSSGSTLQALHARVDTILNASVPNKHDLGVMTLLEKVDAIAAYNRDVERSLQYEISVKKKCVERISKLSQTMSFQVVEHEKQLKARDADNQVLRLQLELMQSKYDDAERVLEELQAQVESMRVATRERATAKSPVKANNERLLLLQFSARLETAMQEAKAVVDQKDARIRDLEDLVKQLQDRKKTLERTVSSSDAQFRKEESRWNNIKSQSEAEKARWIELASEWERDKARWIDKVNACEKERERLEKEKTHWEAEKERWQVELAQERERAVDVGKMQAQMESRWLEEKAEWSRVEGALRASLASCGEDLKSEKENAKILIERIAISERDWSAKLAELEEAIEVERRDFHAHKIDEVSQREARIVELEVALKDRESALAQTRDQLAELEAAKTSTGKQVSELQGELERERIAASKDKKKLEKKLRVLMNERKQHLEDAEKTETEMALEVQRLGLELGSVKADCRAKDTELECRRSEVTTLQEQIDVLKMEASVNKEQITVLQECNSKLETDKQHIQEKLEQLEKEKQDISDELEQRTYALEQRAARLLVEQESKLSSEYEERVRDLMGRHSSELLQRDLELRRLRNRRVAQPLPSYSSSSSSSSPSSTSDRSSHSQQDLEQTDAVSASPARQKPSGKRQDQKLAKQKRKINELREQLESLTHALAVANEQESLAKESIEHQRALYERMMYAQDELQTQVNVLKEENWSLNLVLQVAEKRLASEEENYLPMSSRIAEC